MDLQTGPTMPADVQRHDPDRAPERYGAIRASRPIPASVAGIRPPVRPKTAVRPVVTCRLAKRRRMSLACARSRASCQPGAQTSSPWSSACTCACPGAVNSTSQSCVWPAWPRFNRATNSCGSGIGQSESRNPLRTMKPKRWRMPSARSVNCHLVRVPDIAPAFGRIRNTGGTLPRRSPAESRHAGVDAPQLGMGVVAALAMFMIEDCCRTLVLPSSPRHPQRHAGDQPRRSGPSGRASTGIPMPLPSG